MNFHNVGSSGYRQICISSANRAEFWQQNPKVRLLAITVPSLLHRLYYMSLTCGNTHTTRVLFRKMFEDSLP